MTDDREQRIEHLIQRFEKALERLEAVAEPAGRASGAALPPVEEPREPAPPQPPPGPATPPPRPAPPPPRTTPEQPKSLPPVSSAPALRKPSSPADAWRVLRYIGVGLLLLGTAFLFNYVEDEGRGLMWLRVATAFVIGAGLIVVGLRLREREPQFSQVLTGGGTAVWFITGFAAYQVFGLIAAPAGLAWMAVVTLLCFVFSVRQNAESLALIGAIGGLGTPFLFEATARGPAGAVVFVLYVVGCAMAIHVHRGWRPLLWAALIGGWGALAVSLWQYTPDGDGGTAARVTLQFGVTVMWLVFAIVPAWREVAAVANPRRWPRPAWLKVPGDLHTIFNAAPVIAVWMTAWVWDLDKEPTGLVALGLALPYTFGLVQLRGARMFPGFRAAHIQAAVTLWTLALVLMLEGDTLRFGLVTQAAFLHFAAARSGRRLLSIWGHALFFFLGYFLLFGDNQQGLPLLNQRGLADLYTLIAAAVVTLWFADVRQRLIYRYPAHVLFLLMIAREFGDVTNGAAIVSAIWGLYSGVLIVLGIQQEKPKLRTVGLVTLFVVIAKLIFIDLAEVKAIWRVLLFLGFGGALLWLSYYFHRMNQAQRLREMSDLE